MSHVVKCATESKKYRNNFLAAVQVQVGGCMGKRSLNLGADRQAQGEIYIFLQPLPFTSLRAILLKKTDIGSFGTSAAQFLFQNPEVRLKCRFVGILA